MFFLYVLLGLVALSIVIHSRKSIGFFVVLLLSVASAVGGYRLGLSKYNGVCQFAVLFVYYSYLRNVVVDKHITRWWYYLALFGAITFIFFLVCLINGSSKVAFDTGLYILTLPVYLYIAITHSDYFCDRLVYNYSVMAVLYFISGLVYAGGFTSYSPLPLFPLVVVLSMYGLNVLNADKPLYQGGVFEEFFNSRPDISYIVIRFYDFNLTFLEQTEFVQRIAKVYSSHARVYNFTLSGRDFVIAVPNDVLRVDGFYKVTELLADNHGYKAISFNSDILKHTSTFKDYTGFLDFILSRQARNTFSTVGGDWYSRYERYQVIRKEVLDIATEYNLDDVRVLVYCQPIKDSQGVFTSAEALMRLNIQDYGVVYPDEFIPVIEALGVIHEFSMIILSKVCTYLHSTHSGVIKRISVNFSVMELASNNFIRDFERVVNLNDVDFSKVGVEFTESIGEIDLIRFRNIVSHLTGLGCSVYLDDFGTGYSNYDRLIGLGITIVKFDRSLIVLASQDKKAESMLYTFTEVFKNMGIKVLFEGIETEQHELLSKRGGVDYLQGYKYSMPIPIESLDTFLIDIGEEVLC